MKVKITAAIQTAKGELKPGDIVTVKPRTGERWVDEGKARRVRK